MSATGCGELGWPWLLLAASFWRHVVVVASLVLAASVGIADDRTPVPDEPSVIKATKLIREAYAESYSDAGEDGDTRSLVAVLQAGALASKDASMQYAQLREALRLASTKRLIIETNELLLQLGDLFQINTQRERVTALAAIARSSNANEWELCELLFAISDESLKGERLDDAMIAAQASSQVAKRLMAAERLERARKRRVRTADEADSQLLGEAADAEAQRLLGAINRAVHAIPAYKDALKVLDEDPENREANTIVGTYKCFALGSWEDALPYLVRGEDDRVAATAAKEVQAGLENEGEPGVLFEIANEWWSLAADHPKEPETAIGYRQHAQELYRSVAPELTDPVQQALAVKRGAGEAFWKRSRSSASPTVRSVATAPVEDRLRVGEEKVFLSDLAERDAAVGWGQFGKNGDLGHFGRKVKVSGVFSPKGLSVHGVADGEARVTYDLPRTTRLLVAEVAVSDDAVDSGRGGSVTPLTLRVLDERGRVLWQTDPPMQKVGERRKCVVDVRRAKSITLSVLCPGSSSHAMAVWIDPFLIARPIR